MNMDDNNPAIDIELNNEDREDLRAAYQAIPQMIAQESEKQWTATSVFIQLSIALIAVSIAPSIIFESSSTLSSIFSLIVSILGFISSFIWLCFISRYEKIVYFWTLTAREIEEKMSKELNAFQRGKLFARGNEVEVSGETVGYKCIDRLPVRFGLNFMYIVFILIYTALIILNSIRLCF